MRRRRRHIEYPDELYHFGIKGMKWGIRKQRDKQRDKGSKSHKGPIKRIKEKMVANEFQNIHHMEYKRLTRNDRLYWGLLSRNYDIGDAISRYEGTGRKVPEELETQHYRTLVALGRRGKELEQQATVITNQKIKKKYGYSPYEGKEKEYTNPYNNVIRDFE